MINQATHVTRTALQAYGMDDLPRESCIYYRKNEEGIWQFLRFDRGEPTRWVISSNGDYWFNQDYSRNLVRIGPDNIPFDVASFSDENPDYNDTITLRKNPNSLNIITASDGVNTGGLLLSRADAVRLAHQLRIWFLNE